ncbi:hypothetical protein JNL27_16650 [bacterium]|nr:hypothetical protein [bacterium]
MKNFLFIFCFAAVFVSACSMCEDCDLRTTDIYGQVIDSRNGAPISGVLVGRSQYVDSLSASGDTLSLGPSYDINPQEFSGPDGTFHLGFFGEIKPVDVYDQIFAFKPYFSIWKFKSHGSSVLRNDSIIIEMDTVIVAGKNYYSE